MSQPMCGSAAMGVPRSSEAESGGATSHNGLADVRRARSSPAEPHVGTVSGALGPHRSAAASWLAPRYAAQPPAGVGSQPTLPASSAYPTNDTTSSSVCASTNGRMRRVRRKNSANTTPISALPTKPPKPW